MFTGIVEEVGRVVLAQQGKLTIAASSTLRSLELGSSISVNGVCLTIIELTEDTFSVDIMAETLQRSNLDLLSSGDGVNLECPMVLGGPLGGHLVQGHVDATGKILFINRKGKAVLIRFEAPPEVMRYVVEKAFIAVDGISLTVTTREDTSFQVSIVDYTRQHTILADRRVGDLVNLEVDIIAKYVEQMMQPKDNGITVDFLQEHGFLVN